MINWSKFLYIIFINSKNSVMILKTICKQNNILIREKHKKIKINKISTNAYVQDN